MHQSPSASPCSVSLCVCACICLCVSVSLCVCVFVCMCMWSRVSLSIPGCPIPCVDQAGLRLIETYLFLPPVCWDQGCVSPCWAEPCMFMLSLVSCVVMCSHCACLPPQEENHNDLCFVEGPAPFGSSWVKHYCMSRKTAKKFNMIPFEHRSGGNLVSIW